MTDANNEANMATDFDTDTQDAVKALIEVLDAYVLNDCDCDDPPTSLTLEEIIDTHLPALIDARHQVLSSADFYTKCQRRTKRGMKRLSDYVEYYATCGSISTACAVRLVRQLRIAEHAYEQWGVLAPTDAAMPTFLGALMGDVLALLEIVAQVNHDPAAEPAELRDMIWTVPVDGHVVAYADAYETYRLTPMPANRRALDAASNELLREIGAGYHYECEKALRERQVLRGILGAHDDIKDAYSNVQYALDDVTHQITTLMSGLNPGANNAIWRGALTTSAKAL